MFPECLTGEAFVMGLAIGIFIGGILSYIVNGIQSFRKLMEEEKCPHKNASDF